MARTLAKDHTEKSRAILKTAAKVFADTGYDRAAMSQLALACGISKASIYHYYSSKETLLFDILKHHLTDLLDGINAVTLSGNNPKADFHKLVAGVLEAYRGADSEHRLQLEGMRFLPADRQQDLADIQRQIVKRFSSAIRQVAPTFFDQNPDKLRPVTMSLFGMLNWFYLWHQPGKGISREEYAVMATDLLLGGIDRLANSR